MSHRCSPDAGAGWCPIPTSQLSPEAQGVASQLPSHSQRKLRSAGVEAIGCHCIVSSLYITLFLNLCFQRITVISSYLAATVCCRILTLLFTSWLIS